jgi:hypothetical protein
MGLLDWLFLKRTPPTPQPTPAIRIEATLEIDPPRRTPKRRFRKAKASRAFSLVEADFDPDGEASDLMWYGFHIRDEKGLGITYEEAIDFNLHIFNVAGVSFRPDALQRLEFNPGAAVSLRPEDDNQYDKNAVAVWDIQGNYQVGYVPRDQNRRIRSILKDPSLSAIALAEKRRDGKRVSLTVMLGPLHMRQKRISVT